MGFRPGLLFALAERAPHIELSIRRGPAGNDADLGVEKQRAVAEGDAPDAVGGVAVIADQSDPAEGEVADGTASSTSALPLAGWRVAATAVFLAARRAGDWDR